MNAETDEADKAPTTHKWTQAKLTTEQARQWSELRAAVLYTQPAFSDIWYSMMVGQDGELARFDNEMPHVAATDDTYMYINPNRFLKEFDISEQVFVACHEVLHATFGHCTLMYNARKRGVIPYPDGTTLPFDNATIQHAADYVINANLVEGKVGKMPNGAIYDARLIPASMSVLDAYRVLYQLPAYDQRKPNKGKPGSGPPSPGSGAGGFDEHIDPGAKDGTPTNEAISNRNETEWRNAVAGALASAKLQGTLPAGLERLLGKVMSPAVDWTEVLRASITRKLGNGSGSWDHLDQQLVVRGIGAPGRVKYGAGHIIVAVDTSGSIDQRMMDRFMSEVGGILDDVQPRELTLCQCDADIHEWVECSDTGDLKRKILGGGGTDFRPVFERADQDPPDMLIYLTDGYGSYPNRAPAYPVIWGNITTGKTYPWGDVVFVPLKQGR